MSERQWTLPEKLKVLPCKPFHSPFFIISINGVGDVIAVTEETIQAHISKLLSKTHVHMLVGGNLYKDVSSALSHRTNQVLMARLVYRKLLTLRK